MAELQLENVTVIRGRSEDLTQSFPVVTARAVARLEKLLKWTRHLFVPEGELLALKGDSAQEELDEAEQALRRWNLVGDVIELSPWTEVPTTWVIRVRAG